MVPSDSGRRRTTRWLRAGQRGGRRLTQGPDGSQYGCLCRRTRFGAGAHLSDAYPTPRRHSDRRRRSTRMQNLLSLPADSGTAGSSPCGASVGRTSPTARCPTTPFSLRRDLGKPAGAHGPVRRRPLAHFVYDGVWGETPAWAVDPPAPATPTPRPPRASTPTPATSRTARTMVDLDRRAGAIESAPLEPAIRGDG